MTSLPNRAFMPRFGFNNEILYSLENNLEILVLYNNTYNKVLSRRHLRRLARFSFKYVTDDGFIVLRNITSGMANIYICTSSMDVVL